MYSDLTNFLMVLSHGFLTIYIMLLIEFREPQRIWRMRWIVLASLFLVLNGFIRIYFKDDSYLYVSIFTLTIPYILIILWCSRYKGFRVLFNVCTALWMSCIADAGGILAQSLLIDNSWIRLVVRIILYIVLYFVLRLFRPYYRKMLNLLDRGWGVLCLIPATTYLTVLYMISSLLPDNPLSVSIVICSVTMICVFVYILIYLFFTRVLKEYELKNNQDLMSVQILALERQSEANREAEETMRIQRHDMRHQWITLSELVKQGDKQAILDFIGAEQRKLDETVLTRWCQNSVLNAMFLYYFSQAKREKIEIEAKLNISEDLPVDVAELSMVFANALENAIKACTALPEEKRKIICKCVEKPNFMLQIKNPYEGEIKFDSEGLPISEKEGHGIGTRSIAAFCKKHNAIWDYKTKEGWFYFRMSL